MLKIRAEERGGRIKNVKPPPLTAQIIVAWLHLSFYPDDAMHFPFSTSSSSVNYKMSIEPLIHDDSGCASALNTHFIEL